MNVILHPAGAPRGDKTDHHGTSAQPLTLFLPHLDAADQDLLRVEFPNGIVCSRGATVGRNRANETKWNKINRGDLALFFRDNKLIGSGTVVLRAKSLDLARALKFEPDARTGLPYELTYVVNNVQGWDMPRREVWDAIPNGWNNQFGFTVLTGKKADHLIQWLAERQIITEDQYRNLLLRLRQLESTDREVTTIARKEQAYWQRFLFTGSATGTCALCGTVVPTKFMVVAHIKPRHLCSHEERLDHHNVMPACVFGCDALFDKGVVFVENRMIRSRHSDLTGDLKRHIEPLLGKPCRYWNAASAKYFVEHARLRQIE